MNGSGVVARKSRRRDEMNGESCHGLARGRKKVSRGGNGRESLVTPSQALQVSGNDVRSCAHHLPLVLHLRKPFRRRKGRKQQNRLEKSRDNERSAASRRRNAVSSPCGGGGGG